MAYIAPALCPNADIATLGYMIAVKTDYDWYQRQAARPQNTERQRWNYQAHGHGSCADEWMSQACSRVPHVYHSQEA